MSDAAFVVRSFFERMEARDWAGAGELIAPDVRIDYSATNERFDGSNFLAMNRAYPEGWSIEVVETVSAGERAAVQVRVDHGDETFWCAGFYTVNDGVIAGGTEHWVTEGAEEPPAWRQQYTTPR